MKSGGINPDASARVQLDTRIRTLVRDALEGERVSVEEVIFLYTRLLVELSDAAPVAPDERMGFIVGHVVAALELHASRRRSGATT